MKKLRAYDIHIFKLANGTHEYRLEIDDSFFELFDHEMISKGNLLANVSMSKSDSMIQMTFHISGTVELTCDRSLDLFDHPLDFTSGMIYKYGEEDKELAEDVFVIQKHTQTINIASILFELIGLEIPMKKLHPRFQQDDDHNEDEVLMIYTSSPDTDGITEEQNEEPTDPRWAVLKKLKKNN